MGKEIIQKYEELTGYKVGEQNQSNNYKVFKDGKFILTKSLKDMMSYIETRMKITQSVNKNVNNLLLGSQLLKDLPPKKRQQEYKTVACSLNVSDYAKLQKIAEQHNSTVGAVVKRLVDTLLDE
jgi:hypothetical protein